jgi:uncharacterized protein YyaL (SSP411 family)
MPNHLATETSPYLQQHANNPVEWYPWGEQALTLAREQDKPILLSVGYSACHWCHVMAHECFEDEDVAAVMNKHFINIKVDREERPDLDQIYQSAHYLLTRRNGGWPLTMFLTPEQMPFYGGTYFPKEPRYNLPGLVSLLEWVAQVYQEKRAEIGSQNLGLLQALEVNLPQSAGSVAMTSAPFAEASANLADSFDPVLGGFSKAPKFPRPSELEFLLRHAARSGDQQAQEMALFTLRKMAGGGIYDQIGGGFCRYSVDERWAIPHFEKMLYDNGPLLALYADAFAITREARFQQIAEETAAWVMREMQAPEGGYYSALDADSEHEEGKFYVWDTQETARLLTPEEYTVAARHYGFDAPPNFEDKHWNPIVACELTDVAKGLAIAPEIAQQRLASAKAKLFATREQRVRPGRDEKVLVSWNALMIKGMVRAARVFGRDDWLASARRALAFIRATMWKDGRLLATYKDGKAHLNAYLDDYAFLLDALLEMLQAEFRAEDLEFAQALADTLLDQFEDNTQGGFFFTGHDHEKLIHRPKPAPDNATPSGNGVAAFALARLGHLLGESKYNTASERGLKLFYPMLTQHPAAFGSLLAALDEYLMPPQIVVLRGAAAQTWARSLAQEFLPATLAFAIPQAPDMKLPALLDKASGNPVNAWVCQGVKCLPSINNLREMLEVCKSSAVG